MAMLLSSRSGEVIGINGLLLVEFELDASVDDVVVRLLLASRESEIRLSYLAGDGLEVLPTQATSSRACTEWQAVFHPARGTPLRAECIESFLSGAEAHLPRVDVTAVSAPLEGGPAPVH